MEDVEMFSSRIYTGEEGEKQNSYLIGNESVCVLIPATHLPSSEEVDAIFRCHCSHGEYDLDGINKHTTIIFDRNELNTTGKQEEAWKVIEHVTKLVREKNRLIDLI